MTASKQKYSDIVSHLEAAQHELEKAKDIANALTGESYTTGVVTACLSLVSNFADVLGQMEMFLKDKEACKSLEAGETLDRPEGTEYKNDFNVYVVIDILRYLKKRMDNSDTTIVTEDIVFNPDFAEKWGVDSVRENWKQAIDAGLIQCWPERGSSGLEITKTTPLSITDAGIDFLNFAENGFLWNLVKCKAAKVSELSILLSQVAVVKERAEVYGKERDE